MSEPTRLTLLKRLSDGDELAWTDFDALYRPMLRRWLKNNLLSEADVEDLIQEVLLYVMHNIADFQHNTRTGAFRKWLRLSTVNIARNYMRRHAKEQLLSASAFAAVLDGLEDPDSSVSRAFDLDHRRRLLRYLLDEVSGYFEPKTLEIFRAHVLEEATVPETAARHGVTNAAVYVAKSRVLRRLRESGQAWGEEVFED